MNTLRSVFFLLSLAFSTGRALAAPEPPSLDAMLSAEPAVAAAHQLILDGAYDRAEAAARDLLMAGTLPARAFALLALAEAKAGRDDSAACRWQLAQLLEPGLATADLSSYGAVGAFLSRHGLESVGLPESYAPAPGLVPPRPETTSPPRYTEPAKKARLQGLVIAQAVISETGAVLRPRVLKGLPLGLDRAALDAICDWHFVPAAKDGVPIAVVLNLTVNFNVDSPDAVPDAAHLISFPTRLWAYAASDSPAERDHPPLTNHRDIAGLLAAMVDGDTAVMFAEPPRFGTLSVDQLKALRVTFAARDAELAGVSRLVNRLLGSRVEFVPATPGEHLTLTLQNAPLGELFGILAGHGELQVVDPPAPPTSATPAEQGRTPPGR
ncbi:MAG TPA: energy transducer TonB [Thermoanaerobaculia bacterium]|nr:energy transducer TonB [Thermoanaerobaculia bacterium]